MKRLMLVALLLPSLCAAGDLAGFYLRTDPSQTGQINSFNHALAQPIITGISLMVEWSALETAADVYNWPLIDPWIAAAIKKNQSISIGIMAGSFTPAWLLATPYSVSKVTFIYDSNPQGTPLCSALSLPKVWDATFLERYNLVVSNLAMHLQHAVAGIAGGDATASVKIVKVAGINNTTAELRLLAGTGGGVCDATDADAAWAAAGLTPDLITASWNSILGNYIKAFPAAIFPHAFLSVDIIRVNGFPAVNNNGQVYIPSRGAIDSITGHLLASTIPNHVGRFMLQWNALSNIDPTAQAPISGAQGALIGFQMNEFLGTAGGSGCFYGTARLACANDADFKKIVENGLLLGACCIETWAPNVDTLARVAADIRFKRIEEPSAPSRLIVTGGMPIAANFIAPVPPR